MRHACLVLLLLGGPLLSPARADSVTTAPGAGAPAPVWAAPIGEIDLDQDEIDGISVDPDGNTVISGTFRGDLDLGGTRLSSRGEGDVFIASYAADGSLRWIRHLGSAGDDNTFDVATDGGGNIYLSGWYADTLDLGTVALTTAGGQDMFLIKLDSAGDPVWARSFGGAGDDGGNEIAVLANGEIAVAAISNGGFAVGPYAFPAGGTGPGHRDAFVMRLDRSGDLRWIQPFAGPGIERIRAIALDDDHVYAGFQYRRSLQPADRDALESRGDWDGAAARFGPDGALDWLVPVGGAGTDNVRGIGVAPDGSVYISGVFEGPALIVDREVPAIGSRGDDFLMKLSPRGTPLWAVGLGGPGTATGPELEVDARGAVISAVADGPLTVYRNTDRMTRIDPPGGGPTSYLAAFTPDGALRFAYMPTPDAGGRAMGDVLALSRDGRFLAQALRFGGTLTAAGRSFTTPAEVDSAVVFLRLADD